MAKRHEADVGGASDEVLSREMDEVEESEAFRRPGRRTARRPGTEIMIGRPTETHCIRCGFCCLRAKQN